MSETYSAYNIESGLLTGRQFSGSAELRELNTLPGEAWVEAAADPLSQRVMLVTDDYGVQQPVLVPYQPPAPADSEWQTWNWDSLTSRWVATPTLALHKRRAAEPILSHLAVLDTRLARPLGEIVEALLASTTAPEAAVAKLESTNASKQALRDYLSAVNAAADATELADIPSPTLD